MTHTPGPWTPELAHSGDAGWRVVSDAPGYPNDGWIICGSMLGPDSEANARLIAAAPAMLAALHAAVNWYTPPNDSRTPFPLKEIAEAIALTSAQPASETNRRATTTRNEPTSGGEQGAAT